MGKAGKDHAIERAKTLVLQNLESIQISLIRCVDEGMIDLGNERYNEILGLIEEAHLADNRDELQEVIIRSRAYERDIAAWLARRGRTTVSIAWPSI